VIAILGLIKSSTCIYTRTLRFLIPRCCAYLDSLGKFGFRAKSAFKMRSIYNPARGLSYGQFMQKLYSCSILDVNCSHRRYHLELLKWSWCNNWNRIPRKERFYVFLVLFNHATRDYVAVTQF